MAGSLAHVLDYGSSSDDFSDDDVEDAHESPTVSSERINLAEKGAKSNSTTYFETNEGQNDTTSDDDEQEDVDDKETIHQQILNKPAKLPSSMDVLNDLSTPTCSSSVFRNPFKDAEEAEFNILQQHVKMSERKTVEKPVKKSRLPCKMFKKGRCRLGDKCRFSHVVGASLLEHLYGKPVEESAKDEVPQPVQYTSKPVRYNAREEVIDDEDEDEMSNRKKKKKIGINDSLVPPKKALALFDEQRKIETPWSSRR